MHFKYPVYTGNDLGMNYKKSGTDFKVWAPGADNVILAIYPDGGSSDPLARFRMSKGACGCFTCHVDGDLNHRYYTYQMSCGGKKLSETCDPYAKAVGVNGLRSMILDLRETDPENFAQDRGPAVSSMTDLIITEISVADATGDPACGAKNPGKFKALCEEGLKSPDGLSCGLDHYHELGITHVQIMPFYDFATIDESGKKGKAQYNWGYDPLNYNVPEGSYSTDPYHGEVRIRECKEMIAAFHRKGIGVIMDVVYNHVYQVDKSPLQRTVPDYFFRHYEGKLSNGSGCGNEIASENPMVRKYIIDSLCYWVREYHVDGFRFDLMGVFDLEMMREAQAALRRIRPDIILYGEGWSGGLCAYPEEDRCVKGNIKMLPGIGAFSDNIRDRIKGSVFDAKDTGFATGKMGLEDAIRYCVTAGCGHPQANRTAGEYEWAKEPGQVINYLSCHDNLTLWDKLTLSTPELDAAERIRRNCLCAAICYTAQGVPFFLSGEEFARTKELPKGKGYADNSYNLPLSVNQVDYDRKRAFAGLYDYYRGLIEFRKAHPSLRLATAEEIRNSLHFLEGLPENCVGYVLRTEQETLLIIYNASDKAFNIAFPGGQRWGVCIHGTFAGSRIRAEVTGTVRIERNSAFAAVKL